MCLSFSISMQHSETNTKGKLYLIPTVLAPHTQNKFVNDFLLQTIKSVNHYLAENVRTARRYISSLRTGKNIDEIQFFDLDKNTSAADLQEPVRLLLEGIDFGVISESGCPGIADPGSLAVEMAHQKGIKVVPLIGPSSLVLALMASGFNGQQFTFHGYLPIEKGARKNRIKELEREMQKTGYSQIFIETPYRNDKMLADLKQHLDPTTRLCVAANITSGDEFINTRPISEWKKESLEIGKVPTIFIIGR